MLGHNIAQSPWLPWLGVLRAEHHVLNET